MSKRSSGSSGLWDAYCSLFVATPVDMKYPTIDGAAATGSGLRSMVIVVRDSASAVTLGFDELASPHLTDDVVRLLKTISKPPLTAVTEQCGGYASDDTVRFVVTGDSPNSEAAVKQSSGFTTLVAPHVPVSSVENSDNFLTHLSVHGHSIRPLSVVSKRRGVSHSQAASE